MIMRHVSGGKGEKEREKERGEGRKETQKKKCGEGKQTELLWDEKRVRGTATRAGGRGRGRGGESGAVRCVGVREEEEGGKGLAERP